VSEAFDPHDLIRELSVALRYQRWNGAEVVDRAWATPLPVVETRAPEPLRSQAVAQTRAQPVAERSTARVLPQTRTLPPVQARTLPPVARPHPPERDREQILAGLEALRLEIGDCQRCPHAAHRQHIVHGMGNPLARLLIVGSQPGSTEDASGLPFQGEAGALLDKMLAAMGLARTEVWLTTLVLCRSPQDQPPQRDAVSACVPFLRRQFDLIRPEVVLTFGEPAARVLTRNQGPLQAIRGKWLPLMHSELLATWAPEDMLRDAALKREAWADLQLVMARLGLKRR
jgi:uracil-DNA glycosylase family 4